MAEGLFRQLVHGREYRVISAGISAADGQFPSENAVLATAELGVDITSIRSNRLTEETVRNSDFIFGMTGAHIDVLTHCFPEASARAYRLLDFDSSLAEYKKDISDPIGGSLDTYRFCRDQIKSSMDSILQFVHNTPQPSSTPVQVKIALGSDHAGFELKQCILKHLQDRNIELEDCGTDSTESVDYPDFAGKVGQKVGDGEVDLGILCCKTGVGMSIAANKIKGVRAALVFNEEMAALAHQHNDANIICIGSSMVTAESAIRIVDTFLTTSFQGGRHQRRLDKLVEPQNQSRGDLENTDAEIERAVANEKNRQQNHLELIASENFTSRAVMEAQGSVLTNKYAEGYPGKRWYGGCEYVDVVETLAISRAKQLFNAEYANVQPHSGSSANMAVYFAFLKPGDRILTMDLSHGGHLTHGNAANFSGKFFDVVHYGVRKEDERIDYDQLADMAREHKPKMITVGASAYPRIIDFERMGQIAQEVGAYLLADIAHIAGLVVAGVHPSPISHADFVTTTTHKTLRGPRGGLILAREKYGKAINSQTFPGIQGGPLMHVIAAKAVCFKEAMDPAFRIYQQQIVSNAKALAKGLSRNGFRLISEGTDNHLMLIDVYSKGITGKEAQATLDQAGITINKNTIPFETLSPFKASGIRLGTPAVTTRGMKEPQMAAIADMISEALFDRDSADTLHEVSQRVLELTHKFPLNY